MTKEQIIEKLRSGHQLNNRGTGWWLCAPQRAAGAADAEKIDDQVVGELEAEGKVCIALLSQSMRANLPD